MDCGRDGGKENLVSLEIRESHGEEKEDLQ
jgi:hypothetical protein